MRVNIILTDDSGATYEGVAELTPATGTRRTSRASRASRSQERDNGAALILHFELPVRAFIKRYARGLSGPKRFTLLLARLAGGRVDQPIATKDIEKQWNSMTEPMNGPFNAAYPTRARDEGWIDTVARGSVVLRRGWTGAVKGK